MPIVEATGATSPQGRGARGKMIEAAMAEAVENASKECEAIWARPDLIPEQKQEQIAAIMNDDAIRERKHAARARAKAEFADAS